MNKYRLLLLALLLLQATQAHSATEIELVNEHTVDGEKQTYLVNAVYQGEKSRYTLHDPDESSTGAGIYLLSNDAGKTAYYIDTNDGSCHQWSNEELTETLSAFLLQTTGRFNLKTSDSKMEKLLDEPGEAIHGLPTRHLRVKLNFNASYKYLLFKGQYAMERLTDYWLTPKTEIAITTEPIFQKIRQNTGKDDFDEQISRLIGPKTGFPLRSEVQQTRTDKKGAVSSTKIVQYIKTLKEIENLSEDIFQVPDCDQVGAKKMEKKFKALLKDLVD